jgi:hypothetical protein
MSYESLRAKNFADSLMEGRRPVQRKGKVNLKKWAESLKR